MEDLIPRPPIDLAPLRSAFCRMVSRQWQTHVPGVLEECKQALSDSQLAKGRFIGEMYARACYSMLLVSASGPQSLRLPIRAGGLLPPSRRMTIRLGGTLLAGMEHLLPKAFHRRLLLMSALMGMLDLVLDDSACSGESTAIRLAAFFGRLAPEPVRPPEQLILTLARAARQNETPWQCAYWEQVLEPAVLNYCRAEILAVAQTPDATHMGHRWAGIEAAIKGMWYVAGPRMGLQRDPRRFIRNEWNREQQWMADTSLLMQMIDDWVDQDDDRGSRLTPVATGDWTPQSVALLYRKTIRDLAALLGDARIRNPVLRTLFEELYRDYLHSAIEAMRNGIAA